MTIRTLSLLHVSVLTALSRLHSTAVPSPPSPTQVLEVRVEALPPRSPALHVIDDPSTVDSLTRSHAVSGGGWVESRGRELLPLYHVDFVQQGGARAT
jgi:hypothetical protein